MATRRSLRNKKPPESANLVCSREKKKIITKTIIEKIDEIDSEDDFDHSLSNSVILSSKARSKTPTLKAGENRKEFKGKRRTNTKTTIKPNLDELSSHEVDDEIRKCNENSNGKKNRYKSIKNNTDEKEEGIKETKELDDECKEKNTAQKPKSNASKKKVIKKEPKPLKVISDDEEEIGEPSSTCNTKAYENYMKKRLHSTFNNLKQFNLPNLNLKPKKKKILEESSSDDNESSDDWENVENCDRNPCRNDEETLISDTDETKALGELIKNIENSPKSEENEIVLDLNLKGVSKEDVDPKIKAKLLFIRYMRDMQKKIHKLDFMFMLAFGRQLNLKCDSREFQAFSLSIFSEASQEFLTTPETISDLKTLKAILFHINKFTTISKRFDLREITAFEDDQLSPHASVLIFISLMRALGFDTRIILSFSPNSHQYKATPTNNLPTKKKVKNTPKTTKKIKRKRQIISSSDDSSEEKSSDINEEENHSFFGLPRNEVNEVPFFISAEVYLPYREEFVSCSPIIDKIHETVTFINRKKYCYSYAFTSTRVISGQTPYLKRTPYDVSYLYDHEWSTVSQNKRMNSEDIHDILSWYQSCYKKDVFKFTGLIIEEDSNLNLKNIDKLHEKKRITELLKEPLPQTISCYKKHPLYALEKNLLKHEAMYPLEPIGKLKNGTCVYPREYVRLCHTREIWFREAKVVKVGERPAKVVAARMSTKRKLLQQVTDAPQTCELYGPWQVEDYIPPIAKDGKVPKNEHNNVEIYMPKMIPGNCVHLAIDGLGQVCKKNKIDYAPAVVGWQFSAGGWAHPIISGVVVCQENVDKVLKLFSKQLKEKKLKKAQEVQERAIKNWRFIIKSILIWIRLNKNESDLKLPAKSQELKSSKQEEKDSSPTESSLKRTHVIDFPEEPIPKRDKPEKVYDHLKALAKPAENCFDGKSMQLEFKNLDPLQPNKQTESLNLSEESDPEETPEDQDQESINDSDNKKSKDSSEFTELF